jgi:hypothetical protein
LAEVVVAPNENPALEILRQVRAHREENDRTIHPERSATTRREQTLYVSHINKRHLRRALWKSLQAGMIAQEDSTFIMPLYRETQTFRLSGNEMIPANDQQTQALILSSTDYSVLLGNEGNLNFYAHSVSLLGMLSSHRSQQEETCITAIIWRIWQIIPLPFREEMEVG